MQGSSCHHLTRSREFKRVCLEVSRQAAKVLCCWIHGPSSVSLKALMALRTEANRDGTGLLPLYEMLSLVEADTFVATAEHTKVYDPSAIPLADFCIPPGSRAAVFGAGSSKQFAENASTWKDFLREAARRVRDPEVRGSPEARQEKLAVLHWCKGMMVGVNASLPLALCDLIGFSTDRIFLNVSVDLRTELLALLAGGPVELERRLELVNVQATLRPETGQRAHGLFPLTTPGSEPELCQTHYRDLFDSPLFSSITTTNYDLVLEQVAGLEADPAAGRDYWLPAQYTEDVGGLTEHCMVYHSHGLIGKAVLTPSSYLNNHDVLCQRFHEWVTRDGRLPRLLFIGAKDTVFDYTRLGVLVTMHPDGPPLPQDRHILFLRDYNNQVAILLDKLARSGMEQYIQVVSYPRHVDLFSKLLVWSKRTALALCKVNPALVTRARVPSDDPAFTGCLVPFSAPTADGLRLLLTHRPVVLGRREYRLFVRDGSYLTPVESFNGSIDSPPNLDLGSEDVRHSRSVVFIRRQEGSTGPTFWVFDLGTHLWRCVRLDSATSPEAVQWQALWKALRYMGRGLSIAACCPDDITPAYPAEATVCELLSDPAGPGQVVDVRCSRQFPAIALADSPRALWMVQGGRWSCLGPMVRTLDEIPATSRLPRLPMPTALSGVGPKHGLLLTMVRAQELGLPVPVWVVRRALDLIPLESLQAADSCGFRTWPAEDGTVARIKPVSKWDDDSGRVEWTLFDPDRRYPAVTHPLGVKFAAGTGAAARIFGDFAVVRCGAGDGYNVVVLRGKGYVEAMPCDMWVFEGDAAWDLIVEVLWRSTTG
ncbi:hypothetical protein J8273_0231 [Carpediemonas membranifera]|uniref:Uncharacterized protein n=1 Tax=Carpediemonas membranifera TaxID=201153 RepID=A0A8J6E0E8_9EUKA|nr:hypothetical protein J8273_0231 [Carpediemonas membranifera]|eukprot:KAG9395019.1 hypothetical protein J8273_0231 [Carpediemonas membranifera]